MTPKKIIKKLVNVQRLGHVAVRVKDVDRAKAFYLGLGMKLVWDDIDWCYLEAGSSRDGLALLGPGYKSAGPHFAFHFCNKSELSDARTQLIDSGAQVGELYSHRDGTASFYLKDPEGNWLEMLYHPPEGIPSNQLENE